ncbi:2TM domain-containing protein [Flavobacterium capsici]|uniref:2TM domain-containing protein n=1 Tax=Flavobacterium capsici TaxID=3075618 RepID=A0AA96F2Z0_9FLAO|nr:MULTISPECIES: 2TM domain-containing protein [unclassified Flavobacterium]WNM20330.1 2TM domain-containing protein [Flavobacterium sp. PMR2A8]WNM21720.1 2TM domain-containing protein [Flavobacterium sp. PMTSA4]
MQKVIQYIFKTIITGIVISFIIAAVLITIECIFGRELVFDEKLKVELGYYLLYGVTLTFINGTFFHYLNNIVVWKKYTKYRLLIGALGGISLTMLGIFGLRIVTRVMIEGTSFSEFIQKERFRYYIVSLLITIVITLIFHLIYFYKKSQENKLKEQKVIAGTASAKFESLKNQIDPHFLFNSLNVLSSLIEENPENAQKFTTSLSKIYRYVLEQKDKELVSVEEELSFAKTYMNLLKMRFENSISYEVPTDFINPDAKVVPLSLQLLLENTIKHNIVSENKPLRIKIYIEDNYLIVENNLQKKEVLQERKGVGLQNIVNRYGLLSERKVLVEETADFFRIKIPILTKQIVIMESQNKYNENMAYMKAKERVEKLRGFYSNLISYCCVIPLLIFINLRTTSFQWFWFPMLGWGLGLTFHALETFGFGKSWEEKKIQEIMNKDNKSNQKWN